MKELLVIVVPALILVAFAELNSTYEIGEFGEKKYIRRDRMFFFIIAVSMAVFVGLRVAYNDTFAYRHAYELLETDSSVFSTINWSLGTNPGFNFVNAIMRVVGWSTQDFIMFYALITVCTYVWFIRKYTTNIWLSMFFFVTMGCYTFTMAAIKQTVAVALCLIGTDRVLQKKWKSFLFWVLLASTFHPYALMYLAAPFLMFNPWTKNTYVMLGAFAILGVGLQSLLGTIINITTMMGEEYTTESFSGDGVNIFRLAVIWVPVIVSLLVRKFLRTNNDRANNLIVNLMMLNAEIMFIALFGTANYFARLANYFLLFQTLALPYLFQFFNRNSRRLLKLGALTGYSLYFIYAEGIMYGGFDAMFRKITILEYLQSLF